MSSVAQRLCEGIQTSDQHSHEDVCRATKRPRPQDRIHGTHSKASKPEDVGSRSRKSIIIERHKTVNNVPKDSAIEKQFRSKEIITKKYKTLRDIAVNTVKSGTIKCDTNCVTIVRAREKDHKHCICKSPKQRRTPDDDKITQTNNPHYANKACCGCIEMSTCGTQFVDLSPKSNLQSQDDDKISLTRVLKESKMESQGSNNYNLPNYNKLMVNKNYLRQIFNDANFQQREYEYGKQIPQYSHEMNNAGVEKNNKTCRGCSHYSSAKSGNRWETNELNNRYSQNYESKEICKSQNYMGARNWALSKYITRGPDF